MSEADRLGNIERTLWRCIEHPHVWWVDEPDPEEGEAYCFQCDRQADVEEFQAMDAANSRGAVEALEALRAVLSPYSAFETQGARIQRAREMVTCILADFGEAA